MDWSLMSERQSNVDQAKNLSKQFYCMRSVVCGRHYSEVETDVLDGCHIYDAGLTRYKELRCIPLNIVPLFRYQHRYLDGPVGARRRPHEKIELLLEMIDSEQFEIRKLVVQQIEKLEEIRVRLCQ